MNELLVCCGICLSATSGIIALLCGRGAASDRLFSGQMLIAAICGALGALRSLFAPTSSTFGAVWQVPGGQFLIEVDALSAVFLLPVFLLGVLGACYGMGYYPVERLFDRAKRLRIYFGLIVAAMALLLIAKNSVLFLAGWEVMAISAFMALTVEDEKPEVREAGLVYLVATRIGTLAVIATFALLRVQSGSFSLTLSNLSANSGLATATFLLAFLGFGLKAGLFPLHVWLPAAHANAPTHISALMSGILIKMGIYGLLRVTSFYVTIPLWWGAFALVLAVLSALLGVAFALGQHDFKRLLAYHSVENIGIILLGIAIGLIGRASGAPYLVLLGYAGALLHVINHGLFKALLFLGAGQVIESTGSRNLEGLGGLARKLPHTAMLFLIGSMAIAGLPPLNGFVSELYLYLAMLKAQSMPLGISSIALGFSVPLLALVSAMALACFVKVYAVVFLGEPRKPLTRTTKEGSWTMRLPQYVLAALCVTIGLFPQIPLAVLGTSCSLLGGHLPLLEPNSVPNLTTLSYLHLSLLALVLVFGAIAVRVTRLRSVPTWDCGYVAPSPRMQYGAASIAADIIAMFKLMLRPQASSPKIDTMWAGRAYFKSVVPEVVLEQALYPLVRGFSGLVAALRRRQRGTAHFYLLVLVMTLLAMLSIWR